MSSTYKSYLVNIHWKMLENNLSWARWGWGWEVVLGGSWLAGLTENKTKPFYQLGLGLRLANTCCVALYCWSSKAQSICQNKRNLSLATLIPSVFLQCFENWVQIEYIREYNVREVIESMWIFQNRKSVSRKKDHQPFPLFYKKRMNKLKFYTGCLLLLFLNICLNKFPGQLH